MFKVIAHLYEHLRIKLTKEVNEEIEQGVNDITNFLVELFQVPITKAHFEKCNSSRIYQILMDRTLIIYMSIYLTLRNLKVQTNSSKNVYEDFL